MKDNYYRILLNKDRDAELYQWLEQGRRSGERPGQAIKRKLYKLMEKENKNE